MWVYFRLFLVALRLVRRKRRDLVLENLALRQQLAVYGRSRRPVRLTTDDRRFWSLLARHWSRWRDPWSSCSRRQSCAGAGPRGAGTGAGGAGEIQAACRASRRTSER